MGIGIGIGKGIWRADLDLDFADFGFWGVKKGEGYGALSGGLSWRCLRGSSGQYAHIVIMPINEACNGPA